MRGAGTPGLHTPTMLPIPNRSEDESPLSTGAHSPAEVPGNIIERDERAGLPGSTDSEARAKREAAKLVRSHTLKKKSRFFGFGRRKSRKTARDKDRASRDSGSGRQAASRRDNNDVESDAGGMDSLDDIATGGGVLSALLALYDNLQAASVLSTPARTSLDDPPERPWIGNAPRNERETHPRHRDVRPRPAPQIPMPPVQKPAPVVLPEMAAPVITSPEPEEPRVGDGASRTDIPGPKATLPKLGLNSRSTKTRNAGGVFGPLIASTGNLTAVASPDSSRLQPNLNRPGYHLSRFVAS